MDTITQMALGAVIGQAIGYKKLGWKAPLYGAIGGLIPDLDVLYTGYFGPYGTWQYHRHITHSLFFAPVVAPLLGWLTWAIHKKVPGHYLTHALIWFLAIITHPLLDTLTVYGTMLLAPFSNERFTVSAVSIIDPIYTLPLFIALLLPRRYAQRGAQIALVITTLFLGYCWHLNNKAEDIALKQIAAQNITPEKVSVYTTIFQPYLRRVVVREDVGGTEWLRVGFVSTWNPQPIKWACLKQNGGSYRNMVLQTEGGRLFDWFADGELSFARDGKRLIVMDARYGTPGPSVFGFWGLEFALNKGIVNVNEEPSFIRAPRDVTREALDGLFRAAYGLPNDFLLKEDLDCP